MSDHIENPEEEIYYNFNIEIGDNSPVTIHLEQGANLSVYFGKPGGGDPPPTNGGG